MIGLFEMYFLEDGTFSSFLEFKPKMSKPPPQISQMLFNSQPV